MEFANEIIFEEFYPYRTSRRNCHYCDSCRAASPGSEFSKAEIIRGQLCFQLQADCHGGIFLYTDQRRLLVPGNTQFLEH